MAIEKKKGFSVGERVNFTDAHNKSVTLTGTITKFHEDSDLVDVLTEPDGKAIEVERGMTANISDLTEASEG